jgi:predicted small integral membrane protein
MTLRVAKILLLAAVAFFYSLVVFNNSTDYASNYQFVHHVLLMDTTFPGNHGMWRAIHPDGAHVVFYDGIISWEALTMMLGWIGVIQLVRALRKPAAAFNHAKRISIVSLTVGLLLWFVAFISVGGEWFLMWQSRIWNGQEDSFRNFVEVALVLIFLTRPETEAQP